MPAMPPRRRATAAAGAVILTAAIAAAPTASTASTASTGSTGSTATATRAAEGAGATARVAGGYYDARSGSTGAGRAATLRAAGRAADRNATRQFAASLPGQALFEIDGNTGTVRMLAKLNGYLTGKKERAPRAIVLRYVRAHHDALGLTADDLKTFRLRRDYRDIGGVHHLYFTQSIGGMTVFGNGLTAAVAKHGRLLTIGGSPVSRARLPRPAASRIGSAGAAVADARARLGAPAGSRAGAGDTAERVLFVTGQRAYRAWLTEVMSVDRPATQVVDEASGRLLYRNALGNDLAAGPNGGEVTGQAFRNYPGAPRGGAYVPVSFTRRGWLPRGATVLKGNNSHTYSDVDDNNKPSASEQIRDFDNRLVPFDVKGMSFCKALPCSWNPSKPFSWRTNRAQNGTQVFYFVNRFHDHLQAKPIGFTEAAGNFERVNSSGKGKAGDAVETQTMDGASVANGLPDGLHVDNANMETPRDGKAPTMQMYLQHLPGTPYSNAGDPFPANNTGDEAMTVYHEYTHGLSNRLVVDVLGNSTLGPVQGDAMGEAWSDWYAADALVTEGLEVDRKGEVDLDLFTYDGKGAPFIRSQDIDCTPSSPASRCPQSPDSTTGHTGGYTYADYGKVVGAPEVHGDGEIWGQTLWSLRDKLGSRVSQSLITRAMELAPADPSYLDVRNALLIADTAHFKGNHHGKIWSTFAARGMGFFAGSFGGSDAHPGADSHRPPRSSATGMVTGVVRETGTGTPVAGVPVTLAFQGRGIVNPTAVTAADGTYSLGPVPVGSYAKIAVNGAGYLPVATPLTVSSTGAKADFEIRRDWTAVQGGAKIVDFNGPDFTQFGCGPVHALDTSQATGWGSISGTREQPTNQFKPKFLTVDMGRAVNITQFAVDPSETCGDTSTSATGAFRIETSPDNTTWTVAASGTFGDADRGRLNPVTPVTGSLGVRYVRFWILGNQVPGDFATSCPFGPYDGCVYTDLTELQVYGAAAP